MRLRSAQSQRAAGVLLGQACGDALGVPYEFAPRLPSDVSAEMRGGGLGPYAPGEWSDDTQMACCIAAVIAEGRDLTDDVTLDAVAERFLDWQSTGASDIGMQTASVLRAASHGPHSPGQRLAQAAAAHYASHAQGSAGNGALMRTSIVGLSALGNRDQTAVAARRTAALTHADPLAGDSCALWAEAIRVAVIDGVLDIRSGLDLIPAERRSR